MHHDVSLGRVARAFGSLISSDCHTGAVSAARPAPPALSRRHLAPAGSAARSQASAPARSPRTPTSGTHLQAPCPIHARTLELQARFAEVTGLQDNPLRSRARRVRILLEALFEYLIEKDMIDPSRAQPSSEQRSADRVRKPRLSPSVTR